MVKEISCIHAGFEDCEFLIRSESEEEIIEFARQHAKRTHDMDADRDYLERIMVDV
jgi:predicted small metal-binding protein